uniref:EF-hand domain-containing protein n=1 Tax=Haplochromis burtoni TaxID=8153 RepID=A0A3Q2VKY3_HAPBU
MMESDNSRRAVHSLDSGRFLSILHSIFGLIDDRITGRVFTTFDKDKDGVVGMEEWIEGTASYLPKTNSYVWHGSDCFSMYDLNGDNAISREEMLDFLKERLIRRPNEDPDEGIKDLVEIILKKMDYDLDANVSFKYFEKVVKDENLFLELFGHCLPDFRVICNEKLFKFQKFRNSQSDSLLYLFFQRVEVFEGSVFQEQMEE